MVARWRHKEKQTPVQHRRRTINKGHNNNLAEYLEFFAEDLNLLQLVVHQAGVGGDGAQDGHHALLGRQPGRQLVVCVVEVFDVLQELGARLAPLLQVPPATADHDQILLERVRARNSALAPQQLRDLQHFIESQGKPLQRLPPVDF